jgi:hypothetical protein
MAWAFVRDRLSVGRFSQEFEPGWWLISGQKSGKNQASFSRDHGFGGLPGRDHPLWPEPFQGVRNMGPPPPDRYLTAIRRLDSQGVPAREIACRWALAGPWCPSTPIRTTTRRHRRCRCPARGFGAHRVRARIEAWLTDDQRRNRKQRNTAKRVFGRLVDEHGFIVTYSPVQRFVKKWTARNRIGFHRIGAGRRDRAGGFRGRTEASGLRQRHRHWAVGGRQGRGVKTLAGVQTCRRHSLRTNCSAMPRAV